MTAIIPWHCVVPAFSQRPGCRTFQNQDYAYEIEQKYGRSPEDIFASAYYMTRPDSFFEFYRAEVLEKDWKPSESCYALKKLEDAGKIQCILSDNIFDLEKRAGCSNVLSLRGSIYQNRCPKCGQEYPMEYIRDSKKTPRCRNCNNVVRPGVTLYRRTAGQPSDFTGSDRSRKSRSASFARNKIIFGCVLKLCQIF